MTWKYWESVPQFWKFGILNKYMIKVNLIFTFKNLPDKNLSWDSKSYSCSICLCCTAQFHPHCMVTTPNCDTYPKASPLDSGQIQPWVEHASLGSVLDTPIINASKINSLITWWPKTTCSCVKMLFQLPTWLNKKWGDLILITVFNCLKGKL